MVRVFGPPDIAHPGDASMGEGIHNHHLRIPRPPGAPQPEGSAEKAHRRIHHAIDHDRRTFELYRAVADPCRHAVRREVDDPAMPRYTVGMRRAIVRTDHSRTGCRRRPALPMLCPAMTTTCTSANTATCSSTHRATSNPNLNILAPPSRTRCHLLYGVCLLINLALSKCR